MPLFVCNDCGTVDNTALTNYWFSLGNMPGLGPSQGRPLCSACDPKSESGGKWHGRFARRHWREWLLENPTRGPELLNLRPCFCGADALSHETAQVQMPHKGTRCPGYSPVPWRPEHARPA